MTLADAYFKHVPDYYPSMHIDGYNPEEIYYAIRKKMLKQKEAREEEQEDILPNVKIVSEVKVK